MGEVKDNWDVAGSVAVMVKVHGIVSSFSIQNSLS